MEFYFFEDQFSSTKTLTKIQNKNYKIMSLITNLELQNLNFVKIIKPKNQVSILFYFLWLIRLKFHMSKILEIYLNIKF